MIPVLDIGGTHVTAALVDPARRSVTAQRRDPLDGRGDAGPILDTLLRCAAGLGLPPEAARGAVWGVATPGPFDYRRGIGRFESVGKFDSLRGVDVGLALAEGLPGPPAGVVFGNDAHAFLLGEWLAGAARGRERCVGITLGTGVGSAFLAEGRIREEGPGVPPEGRADLLRVAGRPLEESVSRRAILADYGEPGLDVMGIAERARRGEARASRVLDAAFTGLGRALAPCLTAFGATALVVGGSMAGSFDVLGPALRAGLGEVPTLATITTSELNSDAPLLGAAHIAAEG
ncbi:ROK family protein [Streptomyces profundus]|uniref:ROK family protein n=1 Tax=Streptomyces profundus TaxID=2867410 RepID=UPI001D16DCBF|nr:ROK family protein [Streptomyces sp. MA3_2.13]UED86914.1 ROK family protein [Streptomyces sp. MA3_2.13]